MEDNPYSAPNAAIAEVVPHGETELASLGERFAGALIDGLIMLALLLPVMFLAGYFDGGLPSLGTQLFYGLVGFGVFCAVQFYPLGQSGQTWGKRAMKTRIVDLEGNKPPLGVLIGKRYLPVQAVGLVPVIGNLLILVDSLLVFRADRRCGHDLIAGTRVIKAR